jgi:hypothetical protein
MMKQRSDAAQRRGLILDAADEVFSEHGVTAPLDLVAPLARAIDAGLCRPDLRLTDISLVAGMLGASLRRSSPANRRALAKRALGLLRGGLAPQESMVC